MATPFITSSLLFLCMVPISDKLMVAFQDIFERVLEVHIRGGGQMIGRALSINRHSICGLHMLSRLKWDKDYIHWIVHMDKSRLQTVSPLLPTWRTRQRENVKGGWELPLSIIFYIIFYSFMIKNKSSFLTKWWGSLFSITYNHNYLPELLTWISDRVKNLFRPQSSWYLEDSTFPLRLHLR